MSEKEKFKKEFKSKTDKAVKKDSKNYTLYLIKI
jgi:hypothetical protein